MATTRAIVKRRKAVRSIHKITRAMEMIATVKYQRFRKEALRSRPFMQALREILADLVADNGDIRHPLLGPPAPSDPAGRIALLVISSNRGLAGGHNANILRTAMAFIEAQEALHLGVNLYVVGRKGVSFFRFRNRLILHGHEDPSDTPTPAQLGRAMDFFVDQYCHREVDAVYVAYTRFVSAGLQRPEILRLLPATLSGAASAMTPPRNGKFYDYSPGAQEILDDVLPRLIRAEFRQCFLDAVTSENIARQIAMKRATDNAQKLIRRLTMQYNRARQTQITTELCEIMAGVNATVRNERSAPRAAAVTEVVMPVPSAPTAPSPLPQAARPKDVTEELVAR